ncbi:MAG: DUF3052 family protein [Roseibium sp.]
MANQAGYSGRPLSAKLGLKDGMTCWWHAMPETVSELLSEQAPSHTLVEAPVSGLNFAHIFTADQEELAELLAVLRNQIAPDGMIWVSWPKKSSRVLSTVTEDTVRELCLPIGLVDVKVCAVDETWSGLKLVIRKELRSI